MNKDSVAFGSLGIEPRWKSSGSELIIDGGMRLA